MTWLTIGCHRPERRATGDDSLSLAKVTCTGLLTIGQESFSVSGLRYVHGMGATDRRCPLRAVRTRPLGGSRGTPCVLRRRCVGNHRLGVLSGSVQGAPWSTAYGERGGVVEIGSLIARCGLVTGGRRAKNVMGTAESRPGRWPPRPPPHARVGVGGHTDRVRRAGRGGRPRARRAAIWLH